jgi:ABC-type sugar transport system permease subunit
MAEAAARARTVDATRVLERAEQRLAWALCAPAVIVICVIAAFPLAYTFWESLHLHDLRMPWRGRPFIGLANYAEAAADARFWSALGHTLLFAGASVSLELVFGLALALLLHRGMVARGLARTLALLPWAMPTVVAALLFRFVFEPGGAADALFSVAHRGEAPTWLSDARLAWLPIVLADVWKTSPFVALLLLAGLQAIDPALYEAASIDGANAWQAFRHVTLPGLRPALLVALVFRSLDALRVFDLVYVLTAGGPGTATEPLALYSWSALMRNLRFGYGSALSMLAFALTAALAWLYIRVGGSALLGARR